MTLDIKNPYYITTPIYYVNGDPHVGHVYSTVAADVCARFKRLAGYDVHFLTGTDEHGQKVAQSAEKAGMAPQEFCDQVAQKFIDVLPPFQISNDDFIRTTEERHKQSCIEMWKRLEDNGDIYLDKYAGWYAVRDEAFYTEDELDNGPDPDTKIAKATGAECKWVEEESYFFRLSNYEDPLLKLYEENPDFIGPKSSAAEVISFVKSGLKDLSISRTTFDWGVPVPGNDAHVMYVWIDALTNYISALGWENGEADKMRFWPADVHLVGKEITRFHAVYWPAMLMAAGLDVPKRIFANGWWVVEGEKMSKSLGNVITPDSLLEAYGSDGARFALLREMPFGNDGNFVHENAVQRINNDLANGLGNLAQRTLSMIAKNCDGLVPTPQEFTQNDKTLLQSVYALPEVTEPFIDTMQIHKYLDAVLDVVRAANGYIDAQAPWTLKKTDINRMHTVLYVLVESIRGLAIMAQPVILEGAAKILDQVAVEPEKRDFNALNADHALVSGQSLPAPEGVFPRLELNKTEAA